MKKGQKQEIVECVIMGLLQQGGGAWNEEAGVCQYQTPDGRACALGLLVSGLSDGQKISTGENSSLISQTLGIRMDGELFEFLNHVQCAHDNAITQAGAADDEFFCALSMSMRGVCRMHQLRYPEELLG